jgi:hypothetical protein
MLSCKLLSQSVQFEEMDTQETLGTEYNTGRRNSKECSRNLHRNLFESVSKYKPHHTRGRTPGKQ